MQWAPVPNTNRYYPRDAPYKSWINEVRVVHKWWYSCFANFWLIAPTCTNFLCPIIINFSLMFIPSPLRNVAIICEWHIILCTTNLVWKSKWCEGLWWIFFFDKTFKGVGVYNLRLTLSWKIAWCCTPRQRPDTSINIFPLMVSALEYFPQEKFSLSKWKFKILRQLFEFESNFQIQKRIVSAETIWGNTIPCLRTQKWRHNAT